MGQLLPRFLISIAFCFVAMTSYGDAKTVAPRHRNLPVYQYENDRITITWSELRSMVENQIFQRTGEHHFFKTSIYVDGIEKIKNLPWRKRSITLPAPASAQHAYFIVFKEKNKVWHQSELILLESDNVQTVAPETFQKIMAERPFEIIGQEVLGPLGINADLAGVAVKLSYDKVVYVLRPTARSSSHWSQHELVRKLIHRLGERLRVKPLILADGSCDRVELYESPNDRKGPADEGRFIKNVSAELFFFKVDAAFNGNSFFWDDMLVALATAVHHPWLARSTIDFWLEVQKDFGGVIPREIIKSNLKSLWFESIVEEGEPPRPNLQYTNPYLMHWAADFLYRLNPDQRNFELLSRVTRSMEVYARWIEQNRSVYDEKTQTLIGFVTNALGSGEDDSRGERGNDHSPLSLRTGWVDLLAQQIDLYKGLAKNYEIMATHEPSVGAIKRESWAHQALEKAAASESLLNTQYYDPRRKFFYDLIFDGTSFERDTRYSSVAGFWPIFSASVSPARLQEIIDTQLTPQRFGGEFPIPANAIDEVDTGSLQDADQDGYWAKWSRWPSMASIISEGFRRSGRPEIGHVIMLRFLRGMSESSEAFKKMQGRDSVFEFYGQSSFVGSDGNVHLRGRRGRHGAYEAREDFAGWGKVPPVYSMLVNVLGLVPQADGVLDWNVMLELQPGQSIGLKNLSYQGGNVALLKLTQIDAQNYDVEVSTTKPFKLKIASFINRAVRPNVATSLPQLRSSPITVGESQAPNDVKSYRVHLEPSS